MGHVAVPISTERAVRLVSGVNGATDSKGKFRSTGKAEIVIE